MSDPSDLEAEGIFPMDDAPPGLEDDYNQVEGMMPPRDVPVGAEEFGVTSEGESFALETGDDDGLSAEEAAMHITDTP